MVNEVNTSTGRVDDELLYFSGNIYQPENEYFHYNLWMYATFSIQGVGVLMNSYLVSGKNITVNSQNSFNGNIL